MNLDRRGFSTIEIRDFLNLNNIRPPRTDIYSTKLVWTTVRKLRQRESKKQLTHRQISDVSVEIGYLSFKEWADEEIHRILRTTHNVVPKLVEIYSNGVFLRDSSDTQRTLFGTDEKVSRNLQDDQIHCENKNGLNGETVDQYVWDTVVEVLKKSHLFKDVIKLDVMDTQSKKKSDTELKQLNTQIRHTEKEISKMNKVIGDLSSVKLLGEGDENIDITIQSLTEKRNELRMKVV